MNAAEMHHLAEVVADVLTSRGLVAPRASVGFVAEPLCPLVLTKQQFGIAINRSAKVVGRRIKDWTIDPKHISGPPYAISRDALAKFKVPFPLAAARLAAANKAALVAALAPAPTPSQPPQQLVA